MKPVGITYGREKVLNKLKYFVEKKLDFNIPIRIGISHANCENTAFKFSEDFGKMIGKENVFISEFGPALGAHAGPGAMVISAQTLEDSLND